MQILAGKDGTNQLAIARVLSVQRGSQIGIFYFLMEIGLIGCFTSRWRRFPSQDGPAGGTRFIQALDACRVWRSLHQLGICRGFLRDRTHCIDEEIALFT